MKVGGYPLKGRKCHKCPLFFFINSIEIILRGTSGIKYVQVQKYDKGVHPVLSCPLQS